MDTISQRISHIIRDTNPSLAELTMWIAYFPIPLRKISVTICQTGIPPGANGNIDQDIRKFFESVGGELHKVEGDRLRRKEYSALMEEVTLKIWSRSLVLMLMRCEGTRIDDGGEEVLVDGIWKEIEASQEVFAEGSVIDYTAIFNNDIARETRSTSPQWLANARWYAGKIASRAAGLSEKLLYPKVQRRKNVSRDTASRALEYIQKDIHEITTMDLERIYHETGVQVQGECELRWAWKFNDLKPRAYYCNGGTQYWKSRYMKIVTMEIMDAWPMTHVNRRRFPDSIYYNLLRSETLVLWDFASFTTKLSELKYFVYWLARFLEEDAYVRQHPLQLLDLREGIIEMPIWEMLDEYNEAANVFAEFSIHRVLDRIGLDWEPDRLLKQRNSGMLGVLGNIGLSTALHGIHIGPIVKDKDSGVCVGDDAIGFIEEHQEHILIEHIRKIGDIHPEKFERLKPVQEGEQGIWKFLKRRLTRDFDGFHIGKLFDAPILAYVFETILPLRTITNMEKKDRVYKFIQQVGALFWSINETGYLVDDHDIDQIKGILRRCYYELSLPYRGALPGFRSITGEFTVDLCVPPVEETFDPRFEDWAEYVWNRSLEKFVEMPVIIEGFLAPSMYTFVGDTFQSTGGKFLTFMEDLGYIRMVREEKVVVPLDVDNFRLFRMLLRGTGHPLRVYEFIKQTPFYYDTCVDRMRSSNSAVHSVGMQVFM